MLIKIKRFNQQFALGLRWLIASRDEIDYLKDRENLSYGFVNKIDQHAKSAYRSAVLTNHDYEKSISLAGILSEKYENLILAHKMQNNNYWICIIKDHKVWNELDLNGSTAGDYICDEKNAKKIIALAQETFSDDNLSADTFAYATQQAQEFFPNLEAISLTDILSESKKYYNTYKIIWLQSYRKKIKRLIVISSILLLSIAGIAYLYSSQNAAAREKAQQLKMQQERQRQAMQKARYLKNLETQIFTTHGPKAIHQALNLLNHLNMQSCGWKITHIDYQSKKNNQLELKLSRTNFGDILSFRTAYQDNAINQKIAPDNNNGSKTLEFGKATSNIQPSQSEIKLIKKMLANKEPEQRYKFIASAQNKQLSFQTSRIKKQSYGFMTSNYELSGEGLWELRKIEILMKRFPTTTVNNIAIDIKNNKISWKIKGEIYD